MVMPQLLHLQHPCGRGLVVASHRHILDPAIDKILTVDDPRLLRLESKLPRSEPGFPVRQQPFGARRALPGREHIAPDALRPQVVGHLGRAARLAGRGGILAVEAA